MAPLSKAGGSDMGEEMEIVPEAEEQQEQSAGSKVKAMKAPYQPTQQEIDDHEPYHMPYRAWCTSCVRGRGKNMEHEKMHADLEHLVDTISMDYYFQGQEDDATLSQLCIRDHNSKWTRCFVVPRKGSRPYVVDETVRSLKQIGHSKFIFKTDNEPALLDLKDVVVKRMRQDGFEVIPEHPPVGESQSNGVVERSVQSCGAMTRVHKAMVEESYGLELPSERPLLPWLVMHVGSVLTRFEYSTDGKTAYIRLKGKPYRLGLPPIGECVLYLPLGRRKAGGGSKNKLATFYEPCVFLGIIEGANEFHVGTKAGVVRAASLKRLPKNKRADAVWLADFKGSPWEPVPGLGPIEAPTRVVVPRIVEGPLEGPTPQTAEAAPRRFYIKREDIEGADGIGYTTGCPGCSALEKNLKSLNHNAECRARVQANLETTEAGRARLEGAKKKPLRNHNRCWSPPPRVVPVPAPLVPRRRILRWRT